MNITDFFSKYGNEISNTIYLSFMACMSYIGIKIRRLIEQYEKEKMKKRIVEDSVKYVEQIYKNKNSKDKYLEAEKNILILFQENKIKTTDLERKVLIESACNSLAKKNKN